ncbi:hypothetical protein [uncultured Mitsuokella sp.]|uniref:hypothetical protein n=1 Tax=uncultured Mitsuokella sp. TaxID=453120 RepID=UPI00258881D5|nr:hypothetical protein [uncultured Mitsuokella sp.]
MKEKNLQEAAEWIASAITPSLEPEKDFEEAMNRVRKLAKAELEKRDVRNETARVLRAMELQEQYRRGEIDPRDVWF